MGDLATPAGAGELRLTARHRPSPQDGGGRGRRRAGPAEACQWLARGGRTTNRKRKSQSSGARGAGSLGNGIPPHNQDAEFLSEPAKWHLVRYHLSALSSWRCSLLGLLLGMCAPGGCEPSSGRRAWDSRVYGGNIQPGLEPFLKAWVVGSAVPCGFCYYDLREPFLPLFDSWNLPR